MVKNEVNYGDSQIQKGWNRKEIMKTYICLGWILSSENPIILEPVSREELDDCEGTSPAFKPSFVAEHLPEQVLQKCSVIRQHSDYLDCRLNKYCLVELTLLKGERFSGECSEGQHCWVVIMKIDSQSFLFVTANLSLEIKLVDVVKEQ